MKFMTSRETQEYCANRFNSDETTGEEHVVVRSFVECYLQARLYN